jgi:hypothetical protein
VTEAWKLSGSSLHSNEGVMMNGLYETAVEANAHEEAIASLVEETHMPADVVRSVYERELIQLKPVAKVKDFLLLFSVRRAREALRSSNR